MENTRISTTGSFPDELNASKLIMRPEQVAEEHFDPCLVQMDCRYDEAPLREFVRVPENEIRHHESDALATFGASHGCTHLVTEHLSCSSRRNSATLPAIAPIHQAKAVDLAVIARCLDQALPTSAFARPDTGERRVKGNLELILQIQVGLRQQSQQSWQVGGKLIPQISFHQSFDG